MTTAALRRADWRDQAACAGQDTALWFPAAGQSTTAKQTCDGCPVRAECLYDALETESTYHRYGMYGGLTGPQRRALPALPKPKPDAIAAIRELLAEHDAHQPDERTDPTMSQPVPKLCSIPDPIAQASQEADEVLPIGRLLKWGEDHPDTDVQDQAVRVRAGLLGLRKRYAADQELTAITTEAEQLEKRLAELRAREAELALKPKKKRGSYTRDYDTREVRAWADANGVDCPRVGQIPKRVLEAWRASLPKAG